MLAEPATSPAESMKEPEEIRTPRKAAIAAWIGSALEYYDFFVYGTAAALIFGKLFFPSKDPMVGTIAALATFGVGYVARPIGSFFLGHLGDKYGRKKVLILTLIMMGVSTFLVGCLPTFNQVGILAPILLVTCRLLQGLSAAGEQAGANSMSLEHAPAHRRAFFTSWTISGTQGGLILATLVFIPLGRMPEAQLLSWGWRIPFFFSAFVVGAGIWIRRTLEETPAFKAAQKAPKIEGKVKLPISVLFRENPSSVFKIIFACLYSVVSTVFAVFTLSYASPLRRNRPLLLLRNRPGTNPERTLDASSQPPWGGERGRFSVGILSLGIRADHLDVASNSSTLHAARRLTAQTWSPRTLAMARCIVLRA